MVRPELSIDHLKAVLSEWTGIPIQRMGQSSLAKEQLQSLETQMKAGIIGQPQAISEVVQALNRRFLLGQSHRPIGAFLFVGPSGVGKTEMARLRAAQLFTSDKDLIRLDMSEYQERFSLSRLTGAPPGYVGYDEGGQLTEAVKRQRHAVVLFDEIEKGHPDILHLLLQILDDGRLTDASGVTVDFRHTLIILTSNLGNNPSQDSGLGFQSRPSGRAETSDAAIEEATQRAEATERRTMAAVHRFLRPELLNRLDRVVVFKPLSRAEIIQVVQLELIRLQQRISARLQFAPTQAALEELARRSLDGNSNAREVRRTVTTEIENRLVELLSTGAFSPAQLQTLRIDCQDEGLQLQTLCASEEPQHDAASVPTEQKGAGLETVSPQL